MGFNNPPSTRGATGAVASVNGRTGAVVLDAEDVGAEIVGAAVAAISAQKTAAFGLATLDTDKQVPADQLAHAGGGGGGAVATVNAHVGDVVLGLPDVIHGFTRVDPLEVTAVNAAAPLTITTPDGSGQVVEPCVEYIAEGWHGHKFWGLITGYTFGDPLKENPALYFSDDGITWTPVPGLPFPLDPAPATGNNADPELRLGPDGKLHGFYIKYNNPTGFAGVYHISYDGSTLVGPTLLFQSTIATEQVTGPVVLYDKTANQWVMWYVDCHTAPSTTLTYPIKRRTCAGADPTGTWSAATTCTVTGLPAGRSPWEKHVERRGDQLHMITTFCDTGTGGGNTTLHFGVSDDNGLTWKFNSTPLLSPSASGWDNSIVYRGDIVPLDDGGRGLYGLWYSGRSSGGQWRFGYTKLKVT